VKNLNLYRGMLTGYGCIKERILEWFKQNKSRYFYVSRKQKAMGRTASGEELRMYPDIKRILSGIKKGYSGTAIYTKEKPLSIKPRFGIEKYVRRKN